ncbi:MAG: DNA translocase FtsK, partial [Thermomicrobiales bacterium]|nr:DNA translocase FtsK [Thermomicrobiales bacterium]
RALGALIWRGARRIARPVAALVRALPRPASRPAAPAAGEAAERAAARQARSEHAPIRRADPPTLAPLALAEPASALADDAIDPAAVAEPELASEPASPVVVAPARAADRRRRGRERIQESIQEREQPTIRRTTREERVVAPTRPVAAALPLPEVARLSHYDPIEPNTNDLHAKARLIEETLASFRVEARVREINPGPAVTQFALEPGAGIKVRRITELQNDLALALAAPSIRIEAPIPGLARVGLEIPNEQIATVGLRETLESSTFVRSKAKLPVPLGRDVNGRYVVGDLTRMPHLLIAGATGAGKSVCLNCIISTFLMTKDPDDLKLVMIDPKKVELTGYNGVPHLQCPVVTEMDKVVGALRLTLREMERRYALFARLGVRNLDGYRLKVADEPGSERLPYLVVIIDELADLMMTAPDEVETLLVRLAQMARATGIHLIIATQRPSVDVVTGLIKANVPSRIAFAVSSLTDSRVVLDMPGAERLLGRGDMLYLPADAAKPQRVQGAFLDDRDAQYVVDHWHSVAPVPQYAQEWLDLPSGSPTGSGGLDDDGGEDPLFDQALEVVKQHGTASASMLQRRLRVGYNRAARLIERMEDEGLIGPADGVRGRPVLVGDE